MTTKLHHHTTGFRMAFGLPIADAVDRIVASALSAAAEKMSREREQSFGSRIKQAVKARLAKQQPRTTTAADADNESFGEKLKKAVRKKSGQKQPSRYRKLPPGVHEG
jgi:hypothetical protein